MVKWFRTGKIQAEETRKGETEKVESGTTVNKLTGELKDNLET